MLGRRSALLQRNGKRSGYWSAFAEWIREPFGRSTAGSENSSPTAWANVFSGFRRHFRRIRTETTVRTVSIGTGIRMLFPAPAVDPDGSVVPLAHTTAVELCEATDLYLCDKWRYAPLVVAILCRPEGEPYREQTCRHRAWSMKKLPMDIVLRLYDMLRQAHRYLKRNYPLCYETPRTNGEKTGREGPTWNELLLWAGHFRIDEIEPVRRMNCHDFMDLVQSRIKMNG